jgi:ADP-ribosylglycohydrolase
LPIFLSYGFGIGRGTRAAAQSLTKRTVRWYSNFYDARGANYLKGGGNGAAMRIQPHVWATSHLDDHRHFLSNVVRDAITTHGHIRGILGAALHAVSLAATLDEGAPPEPVRWAELARSLDQLSRVVQDDEVLRERWLPLWERYSQESFADALAKGIDEVLRFFRSAEDAADRPAPLERRYAELAQALGGRTAATRGSGTVSAVLSLWLAHHGKTDPAGVIRCAANLVGSDTDTVATMTGALVGVSAPDELPGRLVDEALIVTEAERLTLAAFGDVAPSFPHPDPLKWQSPRAQADALGLLNGRVVLAGLGPAQEQSSPIAAPDGGLWQWVELEVGQTVLVKRREKLPKLPPSAAPQPRLVIASGSAEPAQPPEQKQLAVEPHEPVLPRRFEQAQAPGEVPRRHAATRRAASDAPAYPDDVREGVALVVKSRFELLLTSRLLMHYARQQDGAIKAAVFAALLAEELHRRDGRGGEIPSP